MSACAHLSAHTLPRMPNIKQMAADLQTLNLTLNITLKKTGEYALHKLKRSLPSSHNNFRSIRVFQRAKKLKLNQQKYFFDNY